MRIRDGVRRGWVWHGQRTILRGDGVNWGLGSRDGWAADLERPDPAPPRSPMANAICERVAGTIQREC